ncbi:glycosyltransferase family 4 protein [Variovorax paradoxus]|uniref:Glycosyltransferase n=1 Tax=Variovorax paradoxus TaxID=34073 RepID=A0A6I6H1H5_VARPD|nr:glycosyltransferase family 4 protein [Variovorax paradoxus]QGW80722.1 glycosyltransferase [Variovorax paradoxus]
MKFVFFSPMATNSAIGRVTVLIVRALMAQGDSAVVVRTEHEQRLDKPAHACDTELIDWTQTAAVEAAISSADALIYQIGNNYSFHCGGLHWLATHPGIVCLHDFMVTHLFAEWAEGRRAEAEAILADWYGEELAEAFYKANTAESFIEMATQSCPMTEWICSMALAVVSHSHWGMARVAQSCAGPLRVVPLPYDAPSCTSAMSLAASPPPQKSRVNILTVGHVNPNKRVDSVIRAIGSSALLRDTVSYRLCGLIGPQVEQSLSRLARDLGVQLVISGEADDAALQQAMNEADIACCLRWPSLEAASATTIEGLLYGKAVIVMDAAFYSELPDDCVRKISPFNEVAELTEVLEELCGNAATRQAMAHRGQVWAEHTFSAPNYARELANLSVSAAAAQPVLSMVGTLVSTLDRWGASPALMMSDEIADALQLFQGHGQAAV